MKKVGVVIAAKGECRDLDNCLSSLAGQTYKNYEVILVDDGLGKRAQEIAKQNSIWITVIENKGNGASGARNTGVEYTNAEYVAFIDSDCIASPEWLFELVQGLESSQGVASCGGSQKIPDDSSWFQKQVALFMKKVWFVTESNKKNNIQVAHLPSCNVIYKRDVFLSVGGFVDKLWPGEDIELNHRMRCAGHKLLFNNNAIVYHYRPDSWKSFLHMMLRYGWAQGMLLRKYGVLLTTHYLAFLLTMLTILLLWKANISLLGLFAVVLFVYCAFNPAVFLMFIAGGIIWMLFFWKGLFFPSLKLTVYSYSNTD